MRTTKKGKEVEVVVSKLTSSNQDYVLAVANALIFTQANKSKKKQQI